jgi:anti-sigma regulatory factor (Ser/Thr protein kinase)
MYMAGVWRLFLATPEAVPAARHALGELQCDDPSIRSVVELLTSELVTNAVRHGASDPHESILLSAERTDGGVRVEVCDEGGGFPERAQPGDLLEPGGNGLFLVDQLSSRWGVIPGKPSCVWFEAEPNGVGAPG